MKLLLVDDDAFLRDMYVTKFTENGDEVTVAEAPEEAYRMAQEGKFDAVVMDMVMPGMTGAELIKKLKADSVTKEVTCIILSNQSEGTDVEAAKAAGAAGYIVKADHVPSEVVTEVHNIIKK